MLIGELLVKSGIITEDQLNEALAIQKENNKRLGEILIELGYLKPKDLIWLLSEQASMPFIELKPEILDSKLIRSFPENFLYNYCIIPLYEIEGKLYIAIGNPANREAIEKIKEFTQKEIVTSAAEPEKIFQLLDKFFLIEGTEPTFDREEFKGSVKINITDNKATIEFVDENGNVKRYGVQGDVIIKLTNLKRNYD